MEFTETELEFPVPEGFPLGSAILVLNVGDYPDVITVFDSVPVVVTSTTSVEGHLDQLLPDESRISFIAPNPFNSSTNVVVDVAAPSALKLMLYDVLGREVMTVTNGAVMPGRHSFSINGNHLAGGVYFVRASSPNGYEEVRKILLVP